jgi:hypothetical protein
MQVQALTRRIESESVVNQPKLPCLRLIQLLSILNNTHLRLFESLYCSAFRSQRLSLDCSMDWLGKHNERIKDAHCSECGKIEHSGRRGR